VPNYKYSAYQIDGKKVNGKMIASDGVELRTKLSEKELFLTDVTEISENISQVRLKTEQLSEFCRELGMMLGSGIPLVRAISIMADMDMSEKQKNIYVALFRSIKQGLMLSEAMEMQGNAFPQLLISMYKASEESGQMDKTSKKMAEHYEKSNKLKKKVSSAMVYPIILSVVTLIVLLIIFLLVLPRFFVVFESFDAELPAITKFMLDLSNGLRNHWALVLCGGLLVVLGINLVMRIHKVILFKDKMLFKIPLVGKLLKTIYTARFAQTLSSTYSSGVSIVNALNNARDTIGNEYVSNQFDEVIKNIRNGGALSESIKKINGFKPKLSASILIGEETGRLEDMLNATADALDYEAEMAISKLTALLEPLMIIIMAVVVGAVMISVMLPLTTLYSSIGAGV